MQETLLSRGPNFAIVPKYPHRETYSTAVEEVCPKLLPREAEELRAESSCLLKKNCPQPNITLEEQKVIREHKEDQSLVVLTAGNGMAMVVMDREDYSDKIQLLLADTNTYKPITKDLPTNSKTNFPKHSGTSKTKEASMTSFTVKCTPPVWLPPNFMIYWTYINLVTPQTHCLQ